MNSKNIPRTGEQPARRPPDDEPERVGEGELDIGPPADSADAEEKDQTTRLKKKTEGE